MGGRTRNLLSPLFSSGTNTDDNEGPLCWPRSRAAPQAPPDGHCSARRAARPCGKSSAIGCRLHVRREARIGWTRGASGEKGPLIGSAAGRCHRPAWCGHGAAAAPSHRGLNVKCSRSSPSRRRRLEEADRWGWVAPAGDAGGRAAPQPGRPHGPQPPPPRSAAGSGAGPAAQREAQRTMLGRLGPPPTARDWPAVFRGLFSLAPAAATREVAGEGRVASYAAGGRCRAGIPGQPRAASASRSAGGPDPAVERGGRRRRGWRRREQPGRAGQARPEGLSRKALERPPPRDSRVPRAGRGVGCLLWWAVGVRDEPPSHRHHP